jgi:hypothetical protein
VLAALVVSLRRELARAQERIAELEDRLRQTCLFSELRDNVAVQEPAQPRRRTASMPRNYGWQVHKGVTATRALLKADMRC